MPWQHTPLAVLLSVATGVAVAVLVVAASRVGDELSPDGTVPLVGVAASAAVWSAGYTLQLASVEPASKLFWHGVAWLGVAGMVVAWPAFVVAYVAGDDWLTRWRVALGSVVPAATAVFVWLPPYRWLVVEEATVVTVDGFARLVTTPGPLSGVFLAYAYAVTVAAAVLLAREAVTSRGLHRKQAGVLLVAGVLPLALGAVRLAGAVPWWWPDPTPFSFVVSLMLVAWGLFRYRLLEQVPVARSLVVEAIRDGVVVLDADRRVVDANPAARRLLGDDEPVVGRPAGDVFARWPRLVDGIADREPGTFELPLDEGLESRTFEAAISPVADDGRHRGTAVVLRDVSARSRHEQRLQVLNRVLRHDLRNQVNVVRGHAELLLDRASDPAVRAEAEAVMDASRDLVELSRKASLVDAARDGEHAAEVVDIADRVTTEVERARREYPAATFEVDAPVSALAYADPLVDAAIENLLENAVEHHDGDEPRVRVSVAETPSYVEVEVADDGPGVPEREHEVLREGVETPLEHGSGLGLWLVNWIVSRSSGDLSIESTPDGSVVGVRFRRAE